MHAALRMIVVGSSLSLPLSACAGGPSPAPPELPAPTVPDAPPGGVPVPALLSAAAALPREGLLQLSLPEAGLVYRLDADGRYWTGPIAGPLVAAPPRVRGQPGVQQVPEPTLDRLRAALAALPPLPVAPPRPPPSALERPGGGPVEAQPMVWGFFKDGVEQRVLVWGDPTVPSSLGPAGPLYVAFDEAALGGWMNE